MGVLGYPRFGAAGGDIGSHVSRYLEAGDGDRVRRPAGRALRVAVARHVGHDHVERVGGVGAARAGVAEECDHLEVAPERVRPAVAENQRQDWAGRRGRPDVDEVAPDAAERDAEARELRERRFLRQPVELVRPVGNELAEVHEVGPERPGDVPGRVRPARRPQPRPEVLERRRRGLWGERHGGGPRRTSIRRGSLQARWHGTTARAEQPDRCHHARNGRAAGRRRSRHQDSFHGAGPAMPRPLSVPRMC